MSETRPFFDRIFENNRRWVAARLDRDPAYFDKLAAGQEPDILFIGCADSRVPPVALMGADAGDVFVHRNVANLVPASDMNAQSVVEFALLHLRVTHVVVCGHYGCGGVAAALAPKSYGRLDPWLRHIKDVHAHHRETLAAIADPEARTRRLVELNVEAQCENVMKTPAFQQARGFDEPPSVHGWVFDTGTGALIDLGFDADARWKTLEAPYGLGFDG